MPTQSLILLSATDTVSVDTSTFSYGEKAKSNGYYNSGNGLHTVVFILDDFNGIVKLQGTLSVDPGNNDWFDIHDTAIDTTDSTKVTAEYRNFNGNFVWVRAAYNLQDGTIREIRYNH
jgi:hypothetical protein